MTGAQRAENAPVRVNTSDRPLSAEQVEQRHSEQAEKARQRFERDEPPHKNAQQGDTQVFRNRAPANDDSAANRIFNEVLDKAVTLSIRDVLAASNDTRRLMQDFTRNKRSPENVNLIDSHDNITRQDEIEDVFQYVAYEHMLTRTPSGEVSAHESLPLLSIKMNIDNLVIDTIIDTGTTICCISDKVWKMLGAALLKKRSTVMRDANGNAAPTLGAMTDVPVNIGGITFYLTFHVCQDAPFDCILGTPFCAVSSMQLLFRPSAEMVVELTDPNSDKTVLIPGLVKNRRAVSYLEGRRSDF